MSDYNFSEIEKKWQKKWGDKKIFEIRTEVKGKKKFYVLEMFPYPSASFLHMGHVRNYTIGDIYARFKRMCGFNVLYPMGFDSFGLPAENAAKKEGVHPRVYTNNAIEKIKEYFISLGNSYDWSRMISTCEPEYYKWNQYFFIKMFEKGLVYRKKAPVNWCPECESVLANEEAEEGKCWRCGTEVVIKELEQWFLKITSYAEELLAGLDKIDWFDKIKTMQRNWIGKSYGTQINFEINGEKWPVFTTRPDTIYGVTFMVISSKHPRLMEIVSEKQKKDVEKFLKKIKKEKPEELEKDGVFTGSYALNPMTGKKIPIWAGNFVVADYGCGMVMAVPAHDQRDFEFAKKYNIPIKIVINPDSYELHPKKMLRAYTGDGTLVNSEKFDKRNNRDAIGEITEFLEEEKLGRKMINYKIRDWLISRQRYWGTPIPFIHCESCKNEIEEKSFYLNFRDQSIWDKLVLGEKRIETRALNPEEKERYFGNLKKGDYLKCINKNTNEIAYFEISNVRKYKNLNNLSKDKSFLKEFFRSIPSIKELEEKYSFTEGYINKINKNGLVAWNIKRVFPGMIPVSESNLPVLLPEDTKFGGKENPLLSSKEFLNTKCPKCGGKAKRDTDTMGGFMDSSWYFLRFCSPEEKDEPFSKKDVDYWMPVDQYIGGAEHAVMHLIYARFFTKVLRDMGFISIDEPFQKLFNQGIVYKDGAKMSKSKGNIVYQTEISKKYGIDTARLFLMSLASPEKQMEWNEDGVNGSFRFLNSIYSFLDKWSKQKIKPKKISAKMESKLNKIIKQATEDIQNFRYNLFVIKLRELFDSIEKEQPENLNKKTLECFLKLLSPFCPHIAEELWEKLGNKTFISIEKWPEHEEKKINEKFEQQEKAVEKLIEDVNKIKKIILEKEKKEIKKVFIYVLPKEIEVYSDFEEEIQRRTNMDEIKIYIVSDKNKYDPENKSSKVKPGKPGIYLE